MYGTQLHDDRFYAQTTLNWYHPGAGYGGAEYARQNSAIPLFSTLITTGGQIVSTAIQASNQPGTGLTPGEIQLEEMRIQAAAEEAAATRKQIVTGIVGLGALMAVGLAGLYLLESAP